jgi:hypothetical protein
VTLADAGTVVSHKIASASKAKAAYLPTSYAFELPILSVPLPDTIHFVFKLNTIVPSSSCEGNSLSFQKPLSENECHESREARDEFHEYGLSTSFPRKRESISRRTAIGVGLQRYVAATKQQIGRDESRPYKVLLCVRRGAIYCALAGVNSFTLKVSNIGRGKLMRWQRLDA